MCAQRQPLRAEAPSGVVVARHLHRVRLRRVVEHPHQGGVEPAAGRGDVGQGGLEAVRRGRGRGRLLHLRLPEVGDTPRRLQQHPAVVAPGRVPGGSAAESDGGAREPGRGLHAQSVQGRLVGHHRAPSLLGVAASEAPREVLAIEAHVRVFPTPRVVRVVHRSLVVAQLVREDAVVGGLAVPAGHGERPRVEVVRRVLVVVRYPCDAAETETACGSRHQQRDEVRSVAVAQAVDLVHAAVIGDYPGRGGHSPCFSCWV